MFAVCKRNSSLLKPPQIEHDQRIRENANHRYTTTSAHCEDQVWSIIEVEIQFKGRLHIEIELRAHCQTRQGFTLTSRSNRRL